MSNLARNLKTIKIIRERAKTLLKNSFIVKKFEYSWNNLNDDGSDKDKGIKERNNQKD